MNTNKPCCTQSNVSLNPSTKKRIAILGSTGSIGTQALEVIASHSEAFEVEVLTAQNNVDLLIEQSIRFKPNAVVISNETHYEKLKNALQSEDIKKHWLWPENLLHG
jgi:1-deoxy-D-xylulose-5-phosphate reductoisomerase